MYEIITALLDVHMFKLVKGEGSEAVTKRFVPPGLKKLKNFAETYIVLQLFVPAIKYCFVYEIAVS